MKCLMQKARMNSITSRRQTLRYSPRLRDTTMTSRYASHHPKSRFSQKPYLKRLLVSKKNMFCCFDFHKDQIRCSTRPTQVCCITRTTKRHQVAVAVEALCSPKTGFTIDTQRNLISTRLKLSRRSTMKIRSLREARRLKGNPSKRIQNLRNIKKETRKVLFAKGKLNPSNREIRLHYFNLLYAVNTTLRRQHFWTWRCCAVSSSLIGKRKGFTGAFTTCTIGKFGYAFL